MTQRLHELLSTMHGAPASSVAALDDADLDAAKTQVFAGADTRSRGRALGILAVAGREGTGALLRRVLLSDADDALREAAAFHLRRFPGAESEAALLRTYRDARGALRHDVLGSIARIGDQASLEHLRSALDGASAPERRAEFAASVIAHRLGVSGSEPTRPERLLERIEGPAHAFATATLTSPKLAEMLPSLAGDLFGLEPRLDRSFGLTCAGRALVLLLDSRAFADDIPALLSCRPALLGLVARRGDEDGTYSTWRLILAGPRSNGDVYVSVHSTNGTRVYYGITKHDAKSFTLNLSSVARPGAGAVAVQAHVSTSAVAVSGLVAHARTPSLCPVRVDQAG
jgi:hypothetical protein